MMDLDLTGKTAVVCGATQGIGFATASQLAKQGASLILIARSEERLMHAVSQIENPERHTYAVADFSHPQSVKEAILKVTSDREINILVNNTGGPNPGKAIDADIEEFRQAFNAHLICNQILAQAVVEGMKKTGYGRIVNVISTSVKQPLPNLGVSNTIRGAVANWSKTLASELGVFGITVNNVLPGATSTGRLEEIRNNDAVKTGHTAEEVKHEMESEVPLKRLAKPEEIANAIAFLCSPAAAYINGINLPVDGGRTLSL